MAQQDLLKFVYSLLLSVIAVNLAFCTRYSTYIEYNLDNQCPPFGKKSKITRFNNSAVLMKPSHMFDQWNDRIADVQCRFTVKANNGDGLFAVIQKMSFRQNGTHCIDYVQFKRSDRQETGKFCGSFDRSNPEFRPSSLNTYAEFDQLTKSGAELETVIFISKERLHAGESLDLRIVYTPYKDCRKVDAEEEYKSVGMNTCIWKVFFCDGFFNCAPPLCIDEAVCTSDVLGTDVIGIGTGTKVTIGALTTMILCFIIFVMCIWICKRHGQFMQFRRGYWSHDSDSPNECSSRSGPLSQEPEGSMNRPVPTAPMLEVAITPPVLDKDLPPTYDSLFPERTTSTTP